MRHNNTWLLLAFAALCLAPARLQAQGALSRVQGLGPDVQVVGGIGVGVGNDVDNHFLGRGRLGLVYAYEPWMLNLGATIEVGALARLGFGGEVEFNHFDGWFLDLGAAAVSSGAVLSHVAAGFTLFGLEWQHRYSEADSDALLFQVRLPFGMWWLLDRKDEEKTKAGKAAAAASRGMWHKPPPAEQPAADSGDAAPAPAPAQPSNTLALHFPLLRLQPSGEMTGLQVEIDGKPEPSAVLGYDVHVEAGDHELVVRGPAGVLLRQAFTAHEGELVRIPVPAP